LQLVEVYQRLGRYPEAAQWLDRFLKVNPDSGDAGLLLADGLLREGKADEAAAAFQKVLDRNPNSLRAIAGLADTHLLKKQFLEAAARMESARKLDPTDPYLALRHAQYLFEGGRVKESQSILETIAADRKEPVLPVLLYHGLT